MSRIKYELRPGTILDLRHYGGVQLRADQQHNAFLKAVVIAQNNNPSGGDLWADLAGFPETLVRIANAIWKARHSDSEGIRKSGEIAHRKFLMSSRVYFEFKACDDVASWQNTWDARRMGIGDLLVEVGICQRIAETIGEDGLWIIYDPTYPNAEEIWDASGLKCLPIEGHLPSENIKRALRVWEEDAVWQIVPFRGHPQESALGGVPRRSYQQEVGYPGAQMLYELGWEELVDWKPVQIDIRIPEEDSVWATRWMDEHLDPLSTIITVQPVERTRQNEFSDAHLWQCAFLDVLRKHPTGQIVVGCSFEERQIAESLLPADVLRNAMFVTMGLMKWMSIVDRSDVHVTANNAGLWIGIAMSDEIVLVDGSREEHPDYSLWIPQTDWFDGLSGKEVTVL